MKTLRLLFLCSAVAGCNGSQQLQLPDPPRIDAFTATPASVPKGGMVTLAWETTGATQVTLTNVGVGDVPVNDMATGSVMTAVNAQSLFVLSATNSRGVKTTALVTVALDGNSAQLMFAALPAVMPAGGSATLVWTAPGAHSVSIAPMGGAPLDLLGQLTTGTISISPAISTTYVLTADGATKTLDLAVAQSVTSFAPSKPLARSGDTVTLSWKTANATKVTLSQPGRGIIATETDPMKVADGSAMDTVPRYPNGTPVPYLLTVEGRVAAVTQVVNVVIGTAPTITTFAGPEYAKTGGKFSLAWTTANADTVELSLGSVVFFRTVTPAQSASGALLLDTPAMPTDYTLTAIESKSGARATKVWTQKSVGATSVTTFTALPATVANGADPVTLSWNVPGARHLTITDADGVTVASGRGPTAETGTRTAYPNRSTRYTLSADNTIDPPVTAGANVTVTTPAAFGASGIALAGNPLNVTWTVGGTSGLQGFPVPTVVSQAVSTGFVDISTTGTKLPFSQTADDATESFTPEDFETWLWGERVSGTFTVSSNGFVVLGPSAGAGETPTPFPNAVVEASFLAAFWDDLSFGPDTSIWWQVMNEAPERTLIVQFDHLHAAAEPSADLVFEVKVHQTGLVTYEYKTLANLGTLMPLAGAQGPANSGIGATPLAGGSLTFFAPAPSPLAVVAGAGEVSGFVKLTNGYLHLRSTPQVVQAGQVAISEVLYAPAAAVAASGEWFEVSNASSYALNLAGWTVDLGAAGSFTVDAGVTLPAGGAVLLGQALRSAGNDDVTVAFAYGARALSDTAGAVSIASGAYRAQAAYSAADAGNGGPGVSVNVDPQPHLVSTDPSTGAMPHALNCNSTGTFGTQLPAQLGSPGALKRCGVPFTLSATAFSWLDVTDAGTPLFNSTTGFDAALRSVDLTSAPFPFMGSNVTTAVVSTNGFIVLKPYTGTAFDGNKTRPDFAAPSGSVVAPLWDDYDQNFDFPTSNAYSKRVAPNEDPRNPGGHWVIQWNHWTTWNDGTDDLNFEVKLFDTGAIEYHYGTLTPGFFSDFENGGSATSWLESVDGGVALVSNVNQAGGVRPSSAVRFTPAP